MVRHRLRMADLGDPDRVQQGSALEIPWIDASFDYVYSIGCLHHTGNLAKSIQEVERVLAPGGRAVVMLYYRHSLRQLLFGLRGALRRDGGRGDDELRGVYDVDQAGEPAPHSDFVSKAEARRLFAGFERVEIDVQNFDDYPFGLKRERFLGNLARVVGLDLYIVADKRA
jgi:SAM-dependent methyltransferase